MSTRLLFAAALASVALPALAQNPAVSAPPAPQASAPAASPPAAYQASAPSAPTLADQCLALLEGRVPANVDPVRLRPQCESLLRAGAAGGQAGAATSGAGVPQGESVRTAYPQAPPELAGAPPGVQRPVSNTLTTNPVGWFSGLGVNVDYRHPFEPAARFSYVLRGWYSRTSASNGDVSTFGTGGGVDMYLLGGRNAGLRLGPRLVFAFGRESIQGTSDFARLGASGELGYDFIASSRLSGSVAGGYGGRLAGDASDDNFASFTAGETGPYVTFGVGYSW